MNNILHKRLFFFTLIYVLNYCFGAICWGKMPDKAKLLEWNIKLKQYSENITEFEKELKNSRKEFSKLDVNKLWDKQLYFEKKLQSFDIATRAKVIPLFIKEIQNYYNDPKALVDTGGSKAGSQNFRPGFGDFDLEAPEKNIKFIQNVLERLVPPNTIVDHGDYIEVEHLRLIVFKRRPITSLPNFKKYSKEQLEKIANDKEIYLHLRLPKYTDDDDELNNAYKNMIKALEIQGHIKKGIKGSLCDANSLFQPQNIELLQSFAKSGYKSMKAADIWGPNAGNKAKNKINRILKSVGFKGGVNGFEVQLEGLKTYAYLNPYILGLNLENISVFQAAMKKILSFADKKSKDLADNALKTLQKLQNKQSNDKKLESMIIAAKLFKIQRKVNQKKLNNIPEITINGLLKYFELPTTFNVKKNFNNTFPFTMWTTDRPRQLPSKIISANWSNYNINTKPCWGRTTEKTTQKADIFIVIAEFPSSSLAKQVYYKSISYDYLQEIQSKTLKESKNKLQQAYKNGVKVLIEKTKVPSNIYEKEENSTTHTERLGEIRDDIKVDFKYGNAILASYKKLSPLFKTTTKKHIVGKKKKIKVKKGDMQSFIKSLKTNPAYLTLITNSSSTVINPAIPIYEQKQGVLYYEKFVIFIELTNIYKYATKKDNNNTLVDTCIPKISEWSNIEEKFRKLAEILSPEEAELSISLTLFGSDTQYQGIAADGKSKLTVQAKLIADEKIFDQIKSSKWQIESLAKDTVMGSIDEIESYQDNTTEKRLRIAKAEFKAPLDMVCAHKEKIKYCIVLRNGKKYESPWLMINIVHPPIILVHGLWSGPDAMGAMGHFLHNKKAAPLIFYAKYHKNSVGPLPANAQKIQSEIFRALDNMKEKLHIKTARVNIVAHSLGGILARMVILGNGHNNQLVGQGENVYKLITIATPHTGALLADWYMLIHPDELTDTTDPRKEDYYILLTFVRWVGKMRDNALKYGPAIAALRSEKNPFLTHLNKSQKNSPYEHIRYYFIAGTKPIVSQTNALRAPTLITLGKIEKDMIKKIFCQPAQTVIHAINEFKKTPKTKKRLNELFAYLSMPETDGVVRWYSATPPQKVFNNIAGTYTVYDDHFSIIQDPLVWQTVYGYLTAMENISYQPTTKEVTQTNHPPKASFTIMPKHPKMGDPVVIVSTSTDPDGDKLSYQWFINGHPTKVRNDNSIELNSSLDNQYKIKLLVTDIHGATATIQHDINLIKK